MLDYSLRWQVPGLEKTGPPTLAEEQSVRGPVVLRTECFCGPKLLDIKSSKVIAWDIQRAGAWWIVCLFRRDTSEYNGLCPAPLRGIEGENGLIRKWTSPASSFASELWKSNFCQVSHSAMHARTSLWSNSAPLSCSIILSSINAPSLNRLIVGEIPKERAGWEMLAKWYKVSVRRNKSLRSV